MYALDENAQEHSFGPGGAVLDDYLRDHSDAIDNILDQAVKKDK
jgi:hypothetical protein